MKEAVAERRNSDASGLFSGYSEGCFSYCLCWAYSGYLPLWYSKLLFYENIALFIYFGLSVIRVSCFWTKGIISRYIRHLERICKLYEQPCTRHLLHDWSGRWSLSSLSL